MKNITTLSLSATATGAALLLLDALVLEKYFYKKRTFNIGEKEGKRTIRAVLISDLHMDKTLWPYYERIAEAINEAEPDIILISGDILDEYARTTAAADQFFALLDYNTPKAAIPGNHDHVSKVPIAALKQVLEQHNCDLLINETKTYTIHGEELAITGVDDFIKGNADFAKAVRNVYHQKHHFLLVHSPLQQEDILKEVATINSQRADYDQLNISYIFAGHNHGGQVAIGSFAPVLPKKSGNYLRGWYNEQKPYLYVSSGVGTSTLPFRFGNRSEIVVLNYQY